MTIDVESILRDLNRYRKAARSVQESLLANLVMLGEIPAPTFAETQRNSMLAQRFEDAGLDDVNTDGAGNVQAVLPGAKADSNILVLAHTDSVFAQDTDHTISIEENIIRGPSVGDNSLGLGRRAAPNEYALDGPYANIGADDIAGEVSGAQYQQRFGIFTSKWLTPNSSHWTLYP